MAKTPPYGGQWKDPKTGSFDQAGYKNYIDTINKNYIDRLRTTPNAEGKYRTTAGYSVGGKDIGLGGATAPTAAQAGAALTAKTPTPAGIPLNTKTGIGAGGAPSAAPYKTNPNKVGASQIPMPRSNAPAEWISPRDIYRPDPTGGVRTMGNEKEVYRPDPNLPGINAVGGARTEGDERQKARRDKYNAWLQSLLSPAPASRPMENGIQGFMQEYFGTNKAEASGGGGINPALTGNAVLSGTASPTNTSTGTTATAANRPFTTPTLTPEQFDRREMMGPQGSQNLAALLEAISGGNLPAQLTPADIARMSQETGLGGTPGANWNENMTGVLSDAQLETINNRYAPAPAPPGMLMPSDFPEEGNTEKYGMFLQPPAQPTGFGGGGPALPAPSRGGGGGGGGDGGGYGGWGEYDLESHPEWWKGLSAGNSEDQQFASILNAMIPSMSPEDQRTAASTLARMFPEFESYNSLTNQGMTPPVPGEVTDATTQQYETTQRAQSILEAITRMGAAGGIKTGTSSEVSPAVAWLQQIADLGQDFGISNTTDMMTPTQLQALMAALDPLLAEGKGAGSKVAPYAEIARMLTDPFYSAGKVFPRTQGANGQMAFGEPNRRIF